LGGVRIVGYVSLGCRAVARDEGDKRCSGGSCECDLPCVAGL
jgi:hypothetical protein